MQLPRGGSALVGDLLNRVFERGFRLDSSFLGGRQVSSVAATFFSSAAMATFAFFLRVEEVGISLGDLLQRTFQCCLQLFLRALRVELERVRGRSASGSAC